MDKICPYNTLEQPSSGEGNMKGSNMVIVELAEDIRKIWESLLEDVDVVAWGRFKCRFKFPFFIRKSYDSLVFL